MLRFSKTPDRYKKQHAFLLKGKENIYSTNHE